MDDDFVELVVHHGGELIYSRDGPRYVGGEAMEISMARNSLSYSSIVHVATEDLKYASVDCIFYLRPGAAMANGLRPITKDDDATELLDAAVEGIVQLFMETTPGRSFVGDNEESDNEMGYRSSDPEAENSHVAADVGVVHLISDSDRTTDPEFMEAMENLGLTNRRRRVRTTFDEYGLEVEQLNEVSVNNQGQDVINQEGGPQLNEDDVVIPDVQNTEDVHARPRATPPTVRPTQPMRANVPAVGRVTRKCGECGAFGHNKRSCIRLRGLQPIQPQTSRQMAAADGETKMMGVPAEIRFGRGGGKKMRSDLQLDSLKMADRFLVTDQISHVSGSTVMSRRFNHMDKTWSDQKSKRIRLKIQHPPVSPRVDLSPPLSFSRRTSIDLPSPLSFSHCTSVDLPSSLSVSRASVATLRHSSYVHRPSVPTLHQLSYTRRSSFGTRIPAVGYPAPSG
ncbi:hypothetical protein LINPERHAP1_LOCUS21416 [Linum perenne]